MFEICRLCAKSKQANDFETTIDDEALNMKQKLKDCCRWDWLKHNDQLPKTVCRMCYRKLLNSWSFCESVASAQTELLRSLQSDNTDYDDEDFPDEISSTVVDKHTIGVLGKPLADDEFLSLFSANDSFNADGTIKPEKITELKLNDWSIFPYKCWKCFDYLKNHNELKAHITANHPDEPLKYICSLCSDGRMYSKLQRGFLSTHVSKYHIPYLKYCCFKCNIFYWNKVKLRSHLQHHDDKSSPSTCKICGKVFLLRPSFRKHQQTHLPKELKTVYECTVCKGTYASKHSLQLHMKLHHMKKGDYEFYCEQCGKGFMLKQGLESHMVSHKTDRKSTCDVCGKTFKTMRAVNVHQLTHSNEKKFKCNECDQKFKRLGTLRRHKLIHTGELPHSCNTCDKRFRRKTMLTIHMRTHTGDRPFHCSVCEYRAYDWSNCHKHMKVKHGIGMSIRSQLMQETTKI